MNDAFNKVVIEAAKIATVEMTDSLKIFMMKINEVGEKDEEVTGDDYNGVYTGMVANFIINAVVGASDGLANGDNQIAETVAARMFEIIGEKTADGLEDYYSGGENIVMVNPNE